ncbi:M23 family peptidase [Fulvimarina endophytica]|uniref:M23 family peptidase n=1 Tax=Fulvimarina endophytica TaxID=2293836 RepID=A0A371XBE6_9HYPH|nr:M23 family metallopeptidase [Fulvimarina endophytica]RFC66364.1 M23 family peptidase [Fulvimarina endophytica]
MPSLIHPSLRTRTAFATAILLVSGLAAGCSADAVRLDDSFYANALPQTAPMQTAAANPAYQNNQGYGAGIDQTMTGSISSNQASPVYAAPNPEVQRGQLPPPQAQGAQPQQTAWNDNSSTGAQSGMAAQPSASQGQTLGAAPSTLQQQAARIASPSVRPNASSSPSSGSTVTVASGDTLSSIARRSGVSAQAIRDANNMTGDTVRLGQRLVLPTGSRIASSTPTDNRQVASISSAPKPYQKAETAAAPVETKPAATASAPVSTPAPAAQAAEPAKPVEVATAAPSSTVTSQSKDSDAAAPQASGISGYRWPVQGRVLQRFGEKVGSRRNDGLNISVPRGTPIKAAENGVVIYAGDGLREFGNTVLVKHDDGLVTVYGHADALKVKRGDTVKRGEQIASSGMTGDTDVPQLHFEVRKNSSPVDPSKYLN